MKTRWHSCNVLQVGAEARQLWQFDARNGGFVLSREQTSFTGEPLPARLISKDWRTLWQRKLNVAWLPPEHVFLRVAQFPLSDFNETLSMVELQLEKLSPMPVAQIVWSIQRITHAKDNMQTVIVTIVSRNVVEEFLGKLEGEGYLADRLELPALDQLQATPITDDGAWIYPEASGGRNMALVAWWYGGVLQNLDLVSLAASAGSSASAILTEQLLQMAWAGEMEGWLTSPPRWHLVADATTAAEWEPALRQGLDQPIDTIAPISGPELAALTAQRAARAEPRATLLPTEFATRYQQQFYDRLWMRGLLAIAGIYVIGVVIYSIALSVLTFQTRSVETQVASLSMTYTNAMQLRGNFLKLKDRQDLKYAALDCWKAVAEIMPETLTLENWSFQDGKRLSLRGTGPNTAKKQAIDFEERIRHHSLFDPLKGESVHIQDSPGTQTFSWDFLLELKSGGRQ